MQEKFLEKFLGHSGRRARSRLWRLGGMVWQICKLGCNPKSLDHKLVISIHLTALELAGRFRSLRPDPVQSFLFSKEPLLPAA